MKWKTALHTCLLLFRQNENCLQEFGHQSAYLDTEGETQESWVPCCTHWHFNWGREASCLGSKGGMKGQRIFCNCSPCMNILKSYALQMWVLGWVPHTQKHPVLRNLSKGTEDQTKKANWLTSVPFGHCWLQGYGTSSCSSHLAGSVKTHRVWLSCQPQPCLRFLQSCILFFPEQRRALPICLTAQPPCLCHMSWHIPSWHR